MTFGLYLGILRLMPRVIFPGNTQVKYLKTHSLPIVRSVAKVLKSLGLKFSITKHGTRIYIYSLKEIKNYFSLIGSNNPKNNEKFNLYLNEKTHRVGCGSGLTGDPGKIV